VDRRGLLRDQHIRRSATPPPRLALRRDDLSSVPPVHGRLRALGRADRPVQRPVEKTPARTGTARAAAGSAPAARDPREAPRRRRAAPPRGRARGGCPAPVSTSPPVTADGGEPSESAHPAREGHPATWGALRGQRTKRSGAGSAAPSECAASPRRGPARGPEHAAREHARQERRARARQRGGSSEPKRAKHPRAGAPIARRAVPAAGSARRLAECLTGRLDRPVEERAPVVEGVSKRRGRLDPSTPWSASGTVRRNSGPRPADGSPRRRRARTRQGELGRPTPAPTVSSPSITRTSNPALADDRRGESVRAEPTTIATSRTPAAPHSRRRPDPRAKTAVKAG
jgi:hypothetical protein